MRRVYGMGASDLAVGIFCTMMVVLTLGAVGEQGRRRAKEMVCVANLRQWHGVFVDYVARHDGQFVTGFGRYGYWWPANLDVATQSWRTNRTWFCPTATRSLIDDQGNIAPGLSPWAWGIFTSTLLGPDGIAGSYGLNGYTIDISGSGSPRREPEYDSGVPASSGWQLLEETEQADNIPVFLDALRSDLWPIEVEQPAPKENTDWIGNDMAACSINRHGGAVNCLFLDGSARKVGLKEVWTLKWHRTFNTEGPWTVAGGVMASDWPEWMRGFKDY